jgi:hypothetical protein
MGVTKSRRTAMWACAAGAVCEEPSLVGRVSREACGESSGPRSGTKFSGCVAMRYSSDSIACFSTSVHVATQPDSRGLYIHRATSSILIGPHLTAHSQPCAVRCTDGAYRRTATYAGVSREERQAELVELGSTPGAPGKRIRRLLHGEAEVPFQ